MRSNVQTIPNVLEPKRRYIVPLFQRQYVWTLERQWAPLWDDIERKVTERLRWNERSGSPDAEDRASAKANPPSEHFLGAIVLDHQPPFGNEVSARLIIDGQQRLTTSQVFLAAARDAARELGVREYPDELHRYVVNAGIMAHPAVGRFKVWTSRFDQAAVAAIVEGGGPDAVTARCPNAPGPQRPRLLGAYVSIPR